MQSTKRITNVANSAPHRFRARVGALLLIPALMFSALFVPTAGAKTLIDPRPENSSTLFGRAVAVIDDIDGDGVRDLAVGAPFQDGDFAGSLGFGNPQNVGKVYLVSGKTFDVIRQLDDPEFQMQQQQKFGGQFGTSVESLGDVDGDGVSDILVGDPHHITLAGGDKIINAGRAFLFSGKTGNLLFTLDDPTPQEGARLGASVAGLGDVNGDGFPDFAVGAPGKNTEGVADSQVGIVYIFSGKNGSLIGSLDFPSPGPDDAGANFGAAVANAGDINNDGVSDILVGAPQRSRAFVFNGATRARLFTIPSPVVEHKAPSFGFALAGGKDLDGDGIPDFVIGAPLLNNLRGSVFIFKGQNGNLQRTIRSPHRQTFARFGASIVLSNVNGSGLPEILVGAPDQNVKGRLNAGEVFIFKTDGALFQLLPSASPQANAGFGYAIAAGDFNGDGTPEPVVGAPFVNVDITASDGDVETHVQIGQIELQ